MSVIKPDLVLHDARGHRWRIATDFQDRNASEHGWLLMQRLADGVEMPYDRVVDVFGYGADGNRYLLGRFDHDVTPAAHQARLAEEA